MDNPLAELEKEQMYEYHEIASIFPMMDDASLSDLADDIKANGLREPIWFYDGKILDGRNRFRACGLVGVEPAFREYDGDDPTAFVISMNLKRRHLDESQRAMVAARLATLGDGQRADYAGASNEAPVVTQASAAELVNVSRPSVQRARVVLQEGTPEIIGEVDGGRLSVSRAVEMIRTPHVARATGVNEWYTPGEYVMAGRNVMGGIDCDPASSEVANKTVGADVFYSVEDDGLKNKWGSRVWMNPPYSQPQIAQFSRALVEKVSSGEVEQACVLVNNATETEWFQNILSCCSAVCFLRGRVRFLDTSGNPSGAPLQGQAVVYIGANVAEFSNEFGGRGCILIKHRE